MVNNFIPIPTKHNFSKHMRRVWWCNGGYEISYGDFKGRRLIRQGHWKKERRLIGKPHASSQMPRTVDISASADDAAAIQSSTVYCDPLAFIAKDRFTPLFHAYIELCNTYMLHLKVFPYFWVLKRILIFWKTFSNTLSGCYIDICNWSANSRVLNGNLWACITQWSIMTVWVVHLFSNRGSYETSL